MWKAGAYAIVGIWLDLKLKELTQSGGKYEGSPSLNFHSNSDLSFPPLLQMANENRFVAPEIASGSGGAQNHLYSPPLNSTRPPLSIPKLRFC